MQAREKQEQLIEDWLAIEDPMERFQLIVEGGAGSLPPFPEEHRVEDSLVPGCQSRVWVAGWGEGGEDEKGAPVFQLRMDSDAPALKGIAALFCQVYSGVGADEVVRLEPEFLGRLGIDRQLTPTRRRGLGQVRRRIVELATEQC